jgi:hypothetical protein
MPWITQLSGTILSIDERKIATVQITFGHQILVPIQMTRGKSLPPQVGERWLLTRDIDNRWTFSMLLSASTGGPEPTDSFDCNMAFLFGGGI